MKKEIKIITFKAQRVGDYIAPDLIIKAEIEVNTDDLPDLKAFGVFYKKEGKIIVDAMLESLPGGLIDAILVELLDQRRSLFSVSFIEKTKE